jgi:hypothetical protein
LVRGKRRKRVQWRDWVKAIQWISRRELMGREFSLVFLGAGWRYLEQ